MAGGNFDINVGKTRPGTYVNVKSKRQQRTKGSSRGTTIVPLVGYDWGPNGEVIKISVDAIDANIAKLGRSVYDDNKFMLLLREQFKNATTCLVYIINSGESAKATSDGLTVTAVYSGTRGNDLSVSIVENTQGGCDVSVYLGTDKVELYEGVKTYADLIAASDGKYVKFSVTAPETTIKAVASIKLTGGTNTESANSSVTAFLDKSEMYRWNTMCFPIDDEDLKQACIAKIKMLRNNVGKGVQAVIPECNADHEGIINVTNSVVVDGRELTIAEACAWVAGATAAASRTESFTYVEYVGATDIVGEKGNEEAIQAIKNGEFFFSRSEEDKIVVEYDINSLHNFTKDRTEDYAKNRVIRVYDSFAEDLALIFPPNKFNNDSDGWLIMEGLGRKLLKSYGPVSDGGDGSIQNIDLENDFYVDKSRSIGDETYFNVGLQAVDSAEKLYFSVSTR